MFIWDALSREDRRHLPRVNPSFAPPPTPGILRCHRRHHRSNSSTNKLPLPLDLSSLTRSRHLRSPSTPVAAVAPTSYTTMPVPRKRLASVNDALLHDKAINASVHDSLSAPRITICMRMRLLFTHNDLYPFHAASALPYSGTKLPLSKRARARAPGHSRLLTSSSLWTNSVIDETHATGLYVHGGRGMVALLEQVDCVLARLPTLGKAPVQSGGAWLSTCQYIAC
jgi:hypothetical protein